MTPAEEQHVRDVLVFFFPNDPKPQQITPPLATLAAEMLAEAYAGSNAIDLLPRVPGFIPGPAWLVSQAVQIAWRQTGKQRIYEMVRRAVAVKKKSEYHMALHGV